MTQSGRVLALRSAGGLAELLTALPALRGLAAHFADRRLVLAAPGWLEPVALLSGAVDGVLPTGSRGPIPGWPPDLAVNLQAPGPDSVGRLRDLRPGELWSYGQPDSPTDVDAPEVPRWCRLLAGYGVRCDPTALDLPAPAELPLAGGLTIIHPGGAAGRRWAPSRWSVVAEALADSGHDVVVTGDADEVDLARAVAAGAGLSPDAVLAGRLDVTGLCAIVACARTVLCAHADIGQLAVAYRTPSVALLSPRAAFRWGPPERRQHVVLGAAGPAAGDPDPLAHVSPEDVLAALAVPAA